MLYRGIIALCFEIHKKVDPFTLNLVGHKVTAVLEGFMYFRTRSDETL
jgi:hypothetical protein